MGIAGIGGRREDVECGVAHHRKRVGTIGCVAAVRFTFMRPVRRMRSRDGNHEGPLPLPLTARSLPKSYHRHGRKSMMVAQLNFRSVYRTKNDISENAAFVTYSLPKNGILVDLRPPQDVVLYQFRMK